MTKVNWKAKNDYEFIQNLRILQDAFKKIGIKRYVEVACNLYRFKNWQRLSTKITLNLHNGSKDIMTLTAVIEEITT
jgi:hypothetical protein